MPTLAQNRDRPVDLRPSQALSGQSSRTKIQCLCIATSQISGDKCGLPQFGFVWAVKIGEKVISFLSALNPKLRSTECFE